MLKIEEQPYQGQGVAMYCTTYFHRNVPSMPVIASSDASFGYYNLPHGWLQSGTGTKDQQDLTGQLSLSREAHPCIILFNLTHHDLCKVTEQPAALCIKDALLAVNYAPTSQAHLTMQLIKS